MLDSNCAILVQAEVNDIAHAFETYYLDCIIREKHGTAVLKLSNRFSAKTMAQNYIAAYKN